MFDRWKQKTKNNKQNAQTHNLAARDPRVPWYVKALAIVVAAYALSPSDLIPDFIPVLGYLDDLLIVPAGIALVVRVTPPDILAEHREVATAALDRPVSWIAASVIIGIWILAISLTVWWASRFL